jgi:ubiquinone/menaquinone biosynthesis C-methylase UbiE
MKKVKSPYFTYPRIPVSGSPTGKNEELPQRLGGRALFSIVFGRLLQGAAADRQKVSILELGAGSGDLSRLMVDVARARKREIRITAVEFSKADAESARDSSRDYPEIHFEVHSFSGLHELPPGGFDLAISGFALHLFAIDKAIDMVKAMDNTARDGWTIVDFRRTRWLTMLAEVIGTWHSKKATELRQAVALTQQAFTGREMKNLAFHAGIADYQWRGWFLLHQTLSRFKRRALSSFGGT